MKTKPVAALFAAFLLGSIAANPVLHPVAARHLRPTVPASEGPRAMPAASSSAIVK
jgi:hypothetical protein